MIWLHMYLPISCQQPVLSGEQDLTAQRETRDIRGAPLHVTQNLHWCKRIVQQAQLRIRRQGARVTRAGDLFASLVTCTAYLLCIIRARPFSDASRRPVTNANSVPTNHFIGEYLSQVAHMTVRYGMFALGLVRQAWTCPAGHGSA